MRKIALVTSLIMMITATACSSCATKTEEQEIVVPIYETDEIDYKTETAEIGDITEKYYVDGMFGTTDTEKVLFKVDGRIKSVSVEEGDEVKEGDLLCELNSDDLESQIEEKEVYLNQAQKTVNTLTANGGSANEIALAQTELEIVQLEYDHLKDSLEDYKVYAPCDGVFSASEGTAFGDSIDDQRGAKNLITVGANVQSGQQLGVVSVTSQKYVLAYVYDNALDNVNFGTRVDVTQELAESKGKVVDIVYEESGGMPNYCYVITLDDDTAFEKGIKVECVFDVYSKLDTVLIPVDALKQTSDRSYVNLLIDGTKIEQDVEVGIEDSDKVEILSGLSGGEQVIIN